ncbi:MAG: hypothetical protein ABEH77_09195 [Halobacteriaceae archaeon]
MSRPSAEDDPEVALPERISEDEFRRIVEDADTVLEVQQEARLPRDETRLILKRLDLIDEVTPEGQIIERLRRQEDI